MSQSRIVGSAGVYGRTSSWVVICLAVLTLSCCAGPKSTRRAYASEDIDVFLAGFRKAVLSHDLTLILKEYIDPTYRREQLEELLEGNQQQFFDELFGLGKTRFEDISDMEFLDEGIEFEPFECADGAEVWLAQVPVRITYEDETCITDSVFVLKHAGQRRTFTVDGPRG